MDGPLAIRNIADESKNEEKQLTSVIVVAGRGLGNALYTVRIWQLTMKYNNNNIIIFNHHHHHHDHHHHRQQQ